VGLGLLIRHFSPLLVLVNPGVEHDCTTHILLRRNADEGPSIFLNHAFS
jgi:hypothetical protein